MPCHATCPPEQHCVTSSTVAAKGRKSLSLILFEKVLALTWKSNSRGHKLACLMFSLFEYLVTHQWLVREGGRGGGRGGGFISSSEASPHINPKLQVQASPSLSFSAYLSLNSTTCNVTKQTNQINQCRGSNVSLNFLFIYLFIFIFLFIYFFISQHGSSRHVPKCIGV